MRGIITGILLGVGGFWLYGQWQKGKFGMFQFQADRIAEQIAILKAQGEPLDKDTLQQVADLMKKLADAGYKYIQLAVGQGKAEKITGDIERARDPDMSQEEANILAERAYEIINTYQRDPIAPERGKQWINEEKRQEFADIMELLAAGNYRYMEGRGGAVAEKIPDLPKEQQEAMVWQQANVIANVIAQKQAEITARAFPPQTVRKYQAGIRRLINQLGENGYRYVRTGRNTGKAQKA